MEMITELNSTEIPIANCNLYKDKIGDYLLFYNALGNHKFLLLTDRAQKVFLLCDGKRNIREIILALQTFCFKEDEVLAIINGLCGNNILELSNEHKKISEKNSKSSVPRAFGIWLHITNNCNLRCSYCYINKNKGGMPISIAEKTVLNAIDQCKKYGIPNLSIKFAGGEPLVVWQNILHVIEFARKKCENVKIKVTFSLISNGTLIREDIAKYLVENRIPVSISLDGVGSLNDRQRFHAGGKGSFSEIVRGIEILKAVNWKPFILITITDKNIDGLRELTTFLLRNGLSFRYSFMRDCDRVSICDLFEASVRYANVLHQCFDDIERWMLTKNWDFNVKFCDVNIDRPINAACGAGRNSVAVDHRGNIALCQMVFDKPIGNIDRNGIFEIIHEQNAMPELRQKIADGRLECNRCIWKSVCAGGCPIFAYKQFGKPNTASPYCYSFKELIPRIVRLRGIKLIREYENKKEVKSYV